MVEIKLFECYDEVTICECAEGRWMLHEDHLRVVQEMKKAHEQELRKARERGYSDGRDSNYSWRV